jgi:hypothetical protein
MDRLAMAPRMIPDAARAAGPPIVSEAKIELRRRLREADEEELGELIRERADEIDARVAVEAFRNPFLTGRWIEALAALPRIASAYELRRELVGHPRTPRPLALRHVGGLYWNELLRVSNDVRLHPLVRRAAERRIVERLPSLAVGERMAIARRASAAVVAALRLDPAPSVLEALLENPRLTEALLVPLAASDRATPRALAILAGDPRWSCRSAIRSALCRNAATPPAAAVRLLPGLSAADLALVAADPRLAEIVRRRARELGGSRRTGAGGASGRTARRSD